MSSFAKAEKPCKFGFRSRKTIHNVLRRPNFARFQPFFYYPIRQYLGRVFDYRLKFRSNDWRQVFIGILRRVEECPVAEGNRHLGLKEVLDALEDRSPGAKAAFVFGFVDRAHDHFTDAAGAEREGLRECVICGSPTTSDVCAFCRLRERVGSRAEHS